MKLRILHITPDLNYYDGRSYYVSSLIKYFRRSGHDVRLLTNGGNSLNRSGVDGKGIYLDAGFFSKKRYINSLNFLKGVEKEFKPDIIHSHHRYCEFLVNSTPALRRKSVFTALSIVDRRYYVDYRSPVIIAVSNAVSNMLKDKFSVDSKKIRIIPNFADSGEIRAAGRERKAGDGFSMLFIGRFHREKDPLTLLKAMKQIGSRNARLCMVGAGEEEAHLRQFAGANALKVSFHSPCEDLLPFYQKADVCVLSSVRDPLPVFMLQSGLHGKCFLGSCTGGISEVIRDGVNGLLFTPGDHLELAEKITYAMNNPAVCTKLGNALRTDVGNCFTERQAVPRILDVYKEIFKS